MSYSNPSPTPAMFHAHHAALNCAQVLECPIGQSTALPKTFNGLALSWTILREMADRITVGKFVVVEHPTCFEVNRLPDGADTKLFYKFCKPVEELSFSSVEDEVKIAMDEIKKAVQWFIEAAVEDLQKIEPKMSDTFKEYRYVPRSLLQRRLLSKAVFRKSSNGTKLFTEALNEMVELGYLQPVGQVICEKLLSFSGKVYDYSALITK